MQLPNEITTSIATVFQHNQVFSVYKNEYGGVVIKNKCRPSVALGWLMLMFALLVPCLGAAQDAPISWQMQDITGKRHQLSQYHGRWVVVNFWAPWCPPCLEEMPELVTFYDAHAGEGVMVLGVAVQYPSVQSVKTYAEEMLISYPVVLGDAQKISIPLPEVLPTTYLYDPEGRLYKIKRGALSKSWLERVLKDAASAQAK